MTTKYRHVFISYCHDNLAEVIRLREDLIKAGENVWWDKDIKPGQDWKFAIRQAMKQSYAVVLCLSEESQRRKISGIYPEAMDAISAHREYSPGSIFLIPVRLSDCEIPSIEIDATRTLDRLQHVDLFPASEREDGLRRLIEAIRLSTHHPVANLSSHLDAQSVRANEASSLPQERPSPSSAGLAPKQGTSSEAETYVPLTFHEGGKQIGHSSPAPELFSTEVNRRELREVITNYFSHDDLEILCDDIRQDLADAGIQLDIRLEYFGGGSISVIVLRLIEYLDRRRHLAYLVAAVRRARPGTI